MILTNIISPDISLISSTSSSIISVEILIPIGTFDNTHLFDPFFVHVAFGTGSKNGLYSNFLPAEVHTVYGPPQQGPNNNIPVAHIN